MNAKFPILGLDVGDSRIGAALSDSSGMLVKPLLTVHRKNMKIDVTRIAELVKQHAVATIVVGLPMNMDGTEGEQAAKVRSFAKKVARETRLEVHFEDERLSTFTATERLVERGVKTGQNRDLIDMEAAAVILESFLERRTQ